MADKKISALDPGAPAALTDLLPAARGGTNVSLMVVDILKAIYPVGSIYANASDGTDPSVLLGFGTWASVGTGRFLVCFNAADTDFNTAGGTGGAKTSVSTGTVSTPTFTGNSNQVTSSLSAGTPAGIVSQPTLVMNAYTPTGNVAAPTFTGNTVNTTSVGAGTPTGNNTAPVLNGTTANTSAVSAGTPAGTNSIPVFTGSALGNHSHELPLQIVSNTLHRLLAAATFGTGTSRAAAANAAADVANVTNANVALTQAVSAGTPAGTINAAAFTGSALATHNHNVVATGTINAPVFTGDALAAHNHNVAVSGTNSAPTFTGTANTLTGTVAQPTFNGNALANHNHTLTPAGTVSQPSYTGNAQNIVPPYVVAYIWKRTA